MQDDGATLNVFAVAQKCSLLLLGGTVNLG